MIIYCDMDGVLADFKTAAVKTNGMSINKWMNIPSSQQKWERIKNTSNLFYKSNKIIMSNKKRFSSYPKYKQDISHNNKFEPLDTSGRFFDDLDHYHIVKLLD